MFRFLGSACGTVPAGKRLSFCITFFLTLFAGSAVAGVAPSAAQVSMATTLQQAESGDSAAQLRLGLAYYYGTGAAKDPSRAAYWFQQAAERGSAWAENDLCILYNEGIGVPVDHVKALNLCYAAAQQKLPDAEYHVAMMYIQGIGTEKEPEYGEIFLESAVLQGNVAAMFAMGRVYELGNIVPQDYDKSADWYSKAASGGYVPAMNDLGRYFATGRGEPTDLVMGYALCKAAATRDPKETDAARNAGIVARYLSVSQRAAGDKLAAEFADPHTFESAYVRVASRDIDQANREVAQQELAAAAKVKAQMAAKEYAAEHPNPKQAGGILWASVRYWNVPSSSPAWVARPPADPWPPKPPYVNGRIVCNTQCINGTCYRTFSDGSRTNWFAPLTIGVGNNPGVPVNSC